MRSGGVCQMTLLMSIMEDYLIFRGLCQSRGGGVIVRWGGGCLSDDLAHEHQRLVSVSGGGVIVRWGVCLSDDLAHEHHGGLPHLQRFVSVSGGGGVIVRWGGVSVR